MYKLIPLLLLQSCSLSGGFAYHPSVLDSEFKEKDYIGFVQGELEIVHGIYFYGRHESMLFISDRNLTEGGSGGVNSVGFFGKLKLLDR